MFFWFIHVYVRALISNPTYARLQMFSIFSTAQNFTMANTKYDFLLKASKLLHLDPIYVWKMNINLDIVVILVFLPSVYVLPLLRYSLFIVFVTTAMITQTTIVNKKMPNPKYTTTKHVSQSLLDSLLLNL